MVTKKRKILVTGATGIVGSYIASTFPKDTLLLTSRDTMDITDKRTVMGVFDSFQPTTVIHLAAKTNVDECEKDTEDAHLVNGLGTQHIAEGCNAANATLIYISTGAVFNGKKKFYTEKDKPSPVNVYGRTKLFGEKAVQKLVKDYIIIRAGWIVGGPGKEKKFLSHIMKQVRDGVKEIHVINDTFGTLTYAKELANYMKFLLDTNKKGIYHYGSEGICSRYDIAQHLIHLLQTDIAVIPVPSDFFANKFFAPRPAREVIRSIKLPKEYSSEWRQSLTSYIMNELL